MKQEIKNYKPHFDELLEKANVDKSSLPEPIAKMINRFRHAHDVTGKAAPDLGKKFFALLIQTDAVISASVYDYVKDKIKPGKIKADKIDKLKLFAMRAKALQLKQKRKFNN